ncbi:metal-dependent hydrolase [Thioalkalivibrio sp. ALJ24]|uniref:metal-dependent hydrolase n=1 Tax=Thioalkalivibrio sp. ALJ24 TaxID=545276 RepID=UPI00036C62EF|nr:metal-dependent hydrolase [Thioalkalivibrio sp. ALJ24]
MDPVTHASLGAAVGGLVLGSRLGRKALVLGALVALIPDLDIFIAYGDAVSDFTLHRGFSHSIPVLLLFSLAAAGLASRIPATRDIGFARWWWFFALVLVTHVLNDALTTYGTQVLWPLPVGPVGTASIFVIDPLYTLPLLIGVIVAAFWRFAPRALVAGLVLSTAYAGGGLALQAWLDRNIQPALAQAGLEDQPRLVQPTPFNMLVWRVTVLDGNHFHEAWVGIFDEPIRPDFETFRRDPHGLEEAAMELEDGRRLREFSGPFLRFHAQYDEDRPPRLVATDIRLGGPGYFPFGFAIAERENGEWQPISSERVREEGPLDDALHALARRAFQPDRIGCMGDLAAPEYFVTNPPPRCRMRMGLPGAHPGDPIRPRL